MNYFEYLNKVLSTSNVNAGNKKLTLDTANLMLSKKNTPTGSLFTTDNSKTINLDGKPIFDVATKENMDKIDYSLLATEDNATATTSSSETTATSETSTTTETTATTGTTSSTETTSTTETKETEKDLTVLEYALKEFLELDKVKEAADDNKDGKLTLDEVKDYVKELAKKDGNAEDLTIEDFEKVIKELGINLEEVLQKEAEKASAATQPEATSLDAAAQTEQAAAQAPAQETSMPVEQQAAPVQDVAPAQYTSNADSYVDSSAPVQATSGGGYSAPAPYNTANEPAQRTIDNMSLEELKTERSTRKSTLSEKQKAVNNVLNGKNEKVKAAEDDAKEAKEAYEKALKEDPAAEPFRKDIEKNLKEIEKTEEKLDKNTQEINKKEGEISEKESSLSGAQADLKALESKLSGLPANSDDKNVTNQRGEVIEQIRKKKEEIAKFEKEISKLKEELDKLTQEKKDLETQKVDLEKTKTQLEEKVKEVCSEDTKAKLEAYNKAKTEAENVKQNELKTAKEEQQKAQEALNEVDKKIAEKRNKSNKDRIQKAIDVAEAEYAKGVKEVGGEDNGKDVLKYTNGARVPWCAAFTSYCYGKGQGDDNNDTFGYNQSSQTIKQQAKNSGHWADKNSGYKPKEGDLAIWTYGGWRGHIGLVTDVNEQTGAFTVIAGNESDKIKKTTYSSPQAVGAKFAGFAKMSDWVA